VVGEEDIGDLGVFGLPLLEFFVEGYYFCVQFCEFGEGMESIELQLEEVEEGVQVFRFFGEFDYIWLGRELHFLLFEVPVVLVGVLGFSLLHSMNKIINQRASIT